MKIDRFRQVRGAKFVPDRHLTILELLSEPKLSATIKLSLSDIVCTTYLFAFDRFTHHTANVYFGLCL